MLLDTSVWIEFFQGAEKSKRVEDILKTEENFTGIITFAEVVNWCLKNNIQDKIKDYIEGIKNGSTILGLNEPIVILAGKINYERKRIEKDWGMMDSIILATAQIYNLKVLTKDSQFKDLPNVEIL
jgi:predicted nucleic acid-binding protein